MAINPLLFNPTPAEEEPVSLSQRLRRRVGPPALDYTQAAAGAEALAQQRRQEEAAQMSQTRRAWEQGMAELSATPDAVVGLGRNLFGAEGSGNRSLRRAVRIGQDATDYAPDVQRLEDIDGIGDALAYGRNAVVTNLPTMGPTLLAAAVTGGAAGVIGGGARVGAQQALREGVKAGVKTAARRQQAAMAAAALPPSVALQANQMTEAALDDTQGGTARERALKATLGATVTGSLEALPSLTLLTRFGLGGQARRQVNQAVLSRVAREGGQQALIEGGTEGLQTLGERATHKWVNDNIELTSPEALGEYMNAMVAGALVGGTLGAPAGLRGNPKVRDKVREADRFFSRATGKMPADQIAPAGPPPRETKGAAPADQFPATPAAPKKDVVEAFEAKEASLPDDPGAPRRAAPADQFTERFERNFESLEDDDDFDAEFEEAVRAWNTPNEPATDRTGQPIEGRDGPVFDRVNIGLEPTGIEGAPDRVRGPIPATPLFNVADAEARVAQSRQSGRLGMTAPQALAASALPEGANVSPDAIKAAALYLTTGDYRGKRAVDSAALREYLGALPRGKRLQLHTIAQVWSERLAEAREAGLDAPMSVREFVEPRADTRRAQAASPEELASLQQGTLQELDQAKELADLIPNAAMKNIGGDLGRYQDPRTGQLRAGFIPVTDSKGGAKAVSLRALRTMVSKVPSLAQSFKGPDADVQRLATALSVLVQKGYTVDPEVIQPGLVISSRKDQVTGDKTMIRLSPAQARTLREGLLRPATVRMPPSPGLPGPATTDRLELDVSGDRTPAGAIDRTPSQALGPGRVPVQMSVDDEGRLNPGEEIDAEGLEDTTQLRREAEAVFFRAAGRLAATLNQGVPRYSNIRKVIKGVKTQRKSLPDDSRLGLAVDAAIRNLEGYLPSKGRLSDDLGKNANEVKRGPAPAETAQAFGDVLRQSGARERGPRYDKDVDELASAKGTPRSLPRMQRLVTLLTQRLGMKDITVVSMPDGPAFGSYDAKTRTLRISDKRGTFARIDTLLHELGHAIIYDTWDALPTEEKRAVLKEYVKWRRNARRLKTYGDVRASRSPPFIRKWMSSRRAQMRRDGKVTRLDTPFSALSSAERKELLSAHEFIADQLARAIGKNPQTRGVVAKVFANVAKALQTVYNLFRGGRASAAARAYSPAPSFERWVERLMMVERARLVNSAPYAEQAQLMAMQRNPPPISVPPGAPGDPAYSPNGGMGPMDLYQQLNQDDRGLIERMFRDYDVIGQIYEQAPQHIRDQLEQYGYDAQTLVNYGAALFLQGKLKVGASFRSPLRRLIDLFKLMLGMPSDRVVTEMILRDYKVGKGKLSKNYDANTRVYRGYTIGEDEDAKVVRPNRVAQRVNQVTRALRRALLPLFDKLTKDAGERLRDSNIPSLRLLAAVIEPRSGERTAGNGFLQTVEQEWQELMRDYLKITEGMDEKDKALLNRALQRGAMPRMLKSKAKYNVMAEKYQQLSSMFEGFYDYAATRGIQFDRRKNYWPVLIDTAAVSKNREAFRALLAQPKFEQAIRAFFPVNDNGKQVPDTTTPIAELVDRMVVIAETADQTHVGEVDFIDSSDGLKMPAFTHARRRIMGFIESLGDAQDRKDFARFQMRSLDAVVVRYTRSLAKRAVFNKMFIYEKMDPVTKRPERHSRLADLYQTAAREGASKEDLAQARDFVAMALGSYRAELNPALKWIFERWDGLFGTKLADTMTIERWGKYQQAVMTYQNVRLLPLAAVSSLIDVFGSYARGGSDATAAFASMKEAMMALKKDNPTELRAMAEAMGIVEIHALSDALAATYGGSFDPSGISGRINNWLFKLNGLEAITRYSRLAALAMGQRFLLKHAEGARAGNETSRRYLQELASDLKPDDIKASPGNPNMLVMNEKVKRALYRFVEESVIRPKPTQRPNWHNDPNFMLVSQYKGYLYSFWNTIPRRMMVELDNNNVKGALMPLVPYVGVTLVGEMLRDMIQGDEEDKAEWGPDDYMAHAFVRAGVLGPRFGVFNDARSDADHGSMIVNSWLGPTGQQLGQLVTASIGERDAGNTLVEALPGSVVYEDWFRE